jgi:hypothetical protein
MQESSTPDFEKINCEIYEKTNQISEFNCNTIPNTIKNIHL